MDEDMTLPRILCLHGGGTNAEIFQLQSRVITSSLSQYFRFIFFNGPFEASPHASIASVYGDMGPFCRWLRWLPEHPEIDDDEAAKTVMDACLTAMKKDRGSGPWAGVMGFSQGAKVGANLLWAQERAIANGIRPLTNFKFAVIMAGLPPWLHYDKRLPKPEHYVDDASGYATDFTDYPESYHEGEHVLQAPTLHVLGLGDEDVEKHRKLALNYCNPETMKLIEWDGDHRVPVEKEVVNKIVKIVVDMADEAGLIWF